MTAQEVQSSSVEKVLEAVRNGTVTAEAALAAENSVANRKPRVTLITDLEEIITGDGDGEEAEEVLETLTVRVSEKVIRTTGGQGAYFDPIQKVTIGKKPVRVEATSFINQKLASRELVRV